MEPLYRRGLENRLLFRVYVEPYGMEGKIKCIHLGDDGKCKLYGKKMQKKYEGLNGFSPFFSFYFSLTHCLTHNDGSTG